MATPTFNPRLIFAASCMGMMLFGITVITVGSNLPAIMERFGLSTIQAGLLTSILPLGILLGSLFFGPVADRYGFKGVIIVSAAFVTLGLQGIAFTHSWLVLQFSVFSIGLGGGAINGATNAVVVDISKGDRSARLTLLGMFFGVGALGVPVLLAGLSAYFSRAVILSGIGTLPLLLILIVLFLRFPEAKQKRGLPIREGLGLLRHPLMLLLSSALLFQSGIESLIANWTTSFLASEYAVADQAALLVLTLHMAVFTVMRLALGFILRLFPFATVLLIEWGLAVIGSLLFLWSNSYQTALLAMMVMALGFAGVFPITLAQIGGHWEKLSGTAFSIALFIALLGGMFFTYLMGQVAYHFGLEKLPLLVLLCVVLQGGSIWGGLRQLKVRP